MGSRARCAVIAAVTALLSSACDSTSSSSTKQPSPRSPVVARATPPGPSLRGLLDRRGLIHAHTVYSHDACDGAPRDPATGAVDARCLDDFRRGVCQAKHDFVMLTEHDDSVSRTDLRQLLLYDDARGDRLLEREGRPVGSWMSCGEGRPALILAGTETTTMMLGLEDHVAALQEERSAIYGSTEAADIERLRAAGAVAIAPHTENWSVERLVELPFDGFEMYNLHENAIVGGGGVIQLIAKMSEPELMPHSDLAMLPIVNEDPRYLAIWAGVLAAGVRRVTTMGTDCHQNTFKSELPDGERMDSYRRTMIWFSNHLLVVPDEHGGFDDRMLKQSLKAGRLYGSFDVLGDPEGFDYHAESSAGIAEMGDEIRLSDAPELVVVAPRPFGLSATATKPVIVTRLLLARESGWEVVASGQGDLRHRVGHPGAYRAEIRMRPRHLAPWLSSFADLAEHDFVWIYANAIYAR